MQLRAVSLACAVLFAAPLAAFAQDEGEADPPETEEAAPAPTTAEADPGTNFNIRRGFYTEADLGVFMTFGGRNTNVAGLPSKGVSNAQPYLGVFLGYDLLHSESYSFAAGLKLAAGYSGGAGRVSDADLASIPADQLQTRPSDFGVLQAGAGLAFGLMATDRIAVTLKADVGLAVVDPNPTKGGGEDGSAGVATGFIAGGGLGVEYFTLLNDFSIGLDLRFAFISAGGASIPAASITAPIKYVF